MSTFAGTGNSDGARASASSSVGKQMSPDILPRGWAAVILAPLVLTVASGAGLAVPWLFSSSLEMHRMLLVVHATTLACMLPLVVVTALAGRPLGAQHPLGQRFVLSLMVLMLLILLLAPVLDPGRLQLLTFFPYLASPLFVGALIAMPVLSLVQLLWMIGHHVRHPAKSRVDGLEGLAWVGLPLLVSLISFAWGWIAGVAHAGHIRAEMATWAAGHAWPFLLVSLMVWSWLSLAGVHGRPRRLWCAAAALPSLSILVGQFLLSVDDTRYLTAFPVLLAWALWPVPLMLVISLLRDEIHRAAGGWLMWLSFGAFAAIPLFALVTLLAPQTVPVSSGWLVVLHGLPLALLLALLTQFSWPFARMQSPRWSPAFVRALVVLVLGSMIALVGWQSQHRPSRDLLKSGALGNVQEARQHVTAKQNEEVATRFKQGVEMMRLRQYDFAVKAFHRVLELDPRMPEAHVNMGFALYETKDFTGAQRFFESATRLNKDQLNAYYGLSLAAAAQSNDEVAVGAMRAWLHLAAPDDPFRQRAEKLYDEAYGRLKGQPFKRGDR